MEMLNTIIWLLLIGIAIAALLRVLKLLSVIRAKNHEIEKLRLLIATLNGTIEVQKLSISKLTAKPTLKITNNIEKS